MSFRSSICIVLEVGTPLFPLSHCRISASSIQDSFCWNFTLFRENSTSTSYSLKIHMSDRGSSSKMNIIHSTTVYMVTARGVFSLMQSCQNIKEHGASIWKCEEEDIVNANPDFRLKQCFKFCIFCETDDTDSTVSFDTFFINPLEAGENFKMPAAYSKEKPCLVELSDDLLKLLNESACHDVELKCGEQIIRAHRNILSVRSEVFKKMLQSDMAEGLTGTVDIKDMEPGDFTQFIRYLYTGKLPKLTTDIAVRLYEAGDKYAVKALVARCSQFFMENLTPENACKLLALADDHSDLDFKEGIITYILEKKSPLKCAGWQDFCKSHSLLATEVLNRFVSSNMTVRESRACKCAKLSI